MNAATPLDAHLDAPIAKWLDLSASTDGAGALYQLTFHEHHIGNPAIRAIHGGVVAALLENAAQGALIEKTGTKGPIETVNIDVDYLRSTRAENMFARARILRLGRRVAFAEAYCWQHDEAQPSAVARLRLRPPIA